jgi:hypothetical protein
MQKLFEGDGLTPINRLRKALFDEYGPSDRRIKKLEKASYFRVDECGAMKGSHGNPLSNVCVITVRVETDLVTVFLSGNVPPDGPVQKWVESVGTVATRKSGSLSLSLVPGEQDKLSGLAKAMLDTVAPGRRYDTPAYKYSCPETASALEHLRKVLDSAWS